MLPGTAGHAVGLEPPGTVVVVVGPPPPTEVVEVVRVVGAGAAVVVPVPGMHWWYHWFCWKQYAPETH